MTLADIIAADLLAVPVGDPPASKEHHDAVAKIVGRALLHVEGIRETLRGIDCEIPDLTSDAWAACMCCGASWPKSDGEPDLMDECAVCAPAVAEVRQ